MQALGARDAQGPGDKHLQHIKEFFLKEFSAFSSPGLPKLDVVTKVAIHVDFLHHWVWASADPDFEAVQRLAQGSPLGIHMHMSNPGIFPAVDPDEVDGSSESRTSSIRSWASPTILRWSKTPMRSRSLSAWYTWEQVAPDGAPTTKRRLIFDGRQSGVNRRARQNQRIALPVALDIVAAGMSLLRRRGQDEHLRALVLDIADAFYQLPLHRAEQHEH
eukprot:6460658-Amphidinium_carterae.1